MLHVAIYKVLEYCQEICVQIMVAKIKVYANKKENDVCR